MPSAMACHYLTQIQLRQELYRVPLRAPLPLRCRVHGGRQRHVLHEAHVVHADLLPADARYNCASALLVSVG